MPRPVFRDRRNNTDSKNSFFENSTDIGRRGSGSVLSSAMCQVVPNSPTPPVVFNDVVVELDSNAKVYKPEQPVPVPV